MFPQVPGIQKGDGSLHIAECIGIARIAAVITPIDMPVDTLEMANTWWCASVSFVSWYNTFISYKRVYKK